MTKRLVLTGSILVLISLWALSGATPGNQPHHTPGADHVVFEHFPTDAHDFRSDLRALIPSIIDRHGTEEWGIVVLTHEFHRHLGIYSIIGAKMGLAAREHFQVGLDELTVLSYAGRRPPISCLNDGLQVSTGATLGHGTISIAEDKTPRPRAQFTYNAQTVTLTLKQSYWDRIQADIRQAIAAHGLNTPDYWQAVRALGLKVWLEWSRHELFDLSMAKI